VFQPVDFHLPVVIGLSMITDFIVGRPPSRQEG